MAHGGEGCEQASPERRRRGRGPAPDRSERALDEEIAGSFIAVMGLMKGHLEATAAEFDLSPPQAIALRHLEPDRPLPMRDLATGLHCDASYVTAIADRLEERSLVERRASPTDRRVKTLVVTDEGARLREELWSRMAGGAPWTRKLTSEERVTLRDLLARMTAAPETATPETATPEDVAGGAGDAPAVARPGGAAL